MAKRGLKLSVRIPNFQKATDWRRGINRAVAEAQKKGPVAYNDTDKLEVQIKFYLRNPKLTVLDIDNRLKDVFDALQGFIGEKGKSGALIRSFQTTIKFIASSPRSGLPRNPSGIQKAPSSFAGTITTKAPLAQIGTSGRISRQTTSPLVGGTSPTIVRILR